MLRELTRINIEFCFFFLSFSVFFFFDFLLKTNQQFVSCSKTEKHRGPKVEIPFSPFRLTAEARGKESIVTISPFPDALILDPSDSVPENVDDPSSLDDASIDSSSTFSSSSSSSSSSSFPVSSLDSSLLSSTPSLSNFSLREWKRK